MDKQITSEQYLKALARAHSEQLTVVETFRNGRSSWEVSHPDQDGHYTVRVSDHGHTLECNCEAGRRGIYCKHRALAHEHEEQERTNEIKQAKFWEEQRISDGPAWRERYAAMVQLTNS